VSRKRREPTKCKDCRRPIKWLITNNGQWLPFDPLPVDPREHCGKPAFPVEQHRAYRLDELVTELMGRNEISYDEARDEAYAFAWHAKHVCLLIPTDTEGATEQ
jgi:hypothetical protein